MSTRTIRAGQAAAVAAALLVWWPAPLAAAQQKPPAPPVQQAPVPSVQQTPAPSPPSQPAVQPAPATGAPASVPPEAYSYVPGGRRDPFVSLIARGDQGRAAGQRPEGLAGLLVSEVALTGIIQARGAFTAIVRGPDGRSHIVHNGDRLLDGVVKAITAKTLVMLEEVNDPLSLTKQREVKRTLRVLEEVK